MWRRFLHRQHEHRSQRSGRRGGLCRPGLSHHAPCHEEPSVRETPPISQRYKQIFQLSSSTLPEPPNPSAAFNISSQDNLPQPAVTARGGCCFSLLSFYFVSYKHVTGAHCNFFLICAAIMYPADNISICWWCFTALTAMNVRLSYLCSSWWFPLNNGQHRKT